MEILQIKDGSPSGSVLITVAIIAAIATIIAALIPLIKRGAPKSESKLSILADKIAQCNILIRFIPIWLIAENEYDSIPANASEDELEVVSTRLLAFIEQSISDHFSAEFFRTNYDKIPKIEAHIILFRGKIQEFRKELFSASKNRSMLKIAWGTILRQELLDLRIDAIKIKEEAIQEYDSCLASMSESTKKSKN